MAIFSFETGEEYLDFLIRYYLKPLEILRLIFYIMVVIVLSLLLVLVPLIFYIIGAIISLLIQLWLINIGVIKKNIFLIVFRTLLSFLWAGPAVFKYIY